MKTREKYEGFTLMELLVVISIIGLLAAVVLVSLNNVRAKGRDARRLSDIRQMMTALELYFNDCAQYPDPTGGLQLTDANGCPAGITYGTFMSKIPLDPTNTGVYIYTYGGTTGAYTITFTLEGVSGGFSAGAHTARPSGVN